jgi:hypothetical protein
MVSSGPIVGYGVYADAIRSLSVSVAATAACDELKLELGPVLAWSLSGLR